MSPTKGGAEPVESYFISAVSMFMGLSREWTTSQEALAQACKRQENVNTERVLIIICIIGLYIFVYIDVHIIIAHLN